ncbi:MAG: hypothetical protein H0V66_01630 [Bdellovibrionales bacterium]|nr:hypothetical protein [Bdellovibrionales bacterium]
MSSLTLIYHFQSSQNHGEDFQPASYKMVYFFNDEGFVDSKVLLELLKAYPDSNYQDKIFLNLDDLKAYAQRVAEELGAPQVRLISVQDYNIGIDGAKDIKSYKELFNKYGEALINEQAAKKKGLFGKIFG